MWGLPFLIIGLSSSVFVAASSLFGMWLVLHFVSPDLANFVLLGASGVLVYPLCWYYLIFRRRDYSTSNTVAVFFLTYLLSFAVAWLLVVGLALHGAMAGSNDEGLMGVVVVAIAFFCSGIIFTVLVYLLPYVVVALPMAFLHREALFTVFGRDGRSARS
jgi:hypothetical protein